MKSLLLIILFCAASATAQTRDSFLKKDHPNRDFTIASSVYWSSVMADAWTTKGLREGNPLLGDGHGGLSWKRATISAEIPFAIAVILKVTHHSKAAKWVLLSLGAGHGAMAIRNQVIK